MKSRLLLLPVIGLVLLISENVECVRFKMAVSSALDEQVKGLCSEVCGTGIMSHRSHVEYSRCSKNCRALITERLRTMCLVCKLESHNNGRCEYSRDCEDSPGIFQLENQSATVAEEYLTSTTEEYLTSTAEETEAENDEATILLEPPEAGKSGKSIVGFTVFLSMLLLLAIVSICHLVLLIFAISQILRASKLE